MKPTHTNAHRTLILVIALPVVLFLLSAFTQQRKKGGDFKNQLYTYFNKVVGQNQERLYLHTDKPYYAANEQIWFRGYLSRAADFGESTLSNFIYVELRDRYDSIVVRKKFRRDSLADRSGFYGSLKIPATVQEDMYTLCAYTLWMRNFGAAFFFSRNLRIGNPLEQGVESAISYETEDNKQVSARMNFRYNNKPLAGQVVACRLSGSPGEVLHQWHARTDSSGNVRFTFEHNARTVQFTKPAVEVILVSEGYNYRHTFHLPKLTNNFMVSFFPEGGKLLAGVEQTVAFKAQHESGYAENIEGVVVNETGDTLTYIASGHDGMGVFKIKAAAGEVLTAHVRSRFGQELSVPLPMAEIDGFSLSVRSLRGQFVFDILAAERTVWPDSLFVVGHTREQLRYILPVSKEQPQGRVPEDIFPAGVTQFLLVNGEGVPLSRRLVFSRGVQTAKITVQTEKQHYSAREEARIRVALTDTSGAPIAGSLSVSVTDGSIVAPDSTTPNILSSMLLTSDLKGYIDCPGYYFDERTPRRARDYHLDLVMLTHGWSRFRTDSALFDMPVPKVEFPPEIRQFVTGRVRNILRRQYVDEATVSLLGPKDTIICYTYTDRRGNFLVDSLKHRDSTELVLRASNERNRGFGMELLIDRESTPLGVVDRKGYSPILPEIPKPYLNNVLEQYIDSGGIPTHHLKEVVVYADRRKNSFQIKFDEEVVNHQSYPAKSLYKPQNQTLLDVLYSIPGFSPATPKFASQMTGTDKIDPTSQLTDTRTALLRSNLKHFPMYKYRPVRLVINDQPVGVSGRGLRGKRTSIDDYSRPPFTYILDDIMADDVASIDVFFLKISDMRPIDLEAEMLGEEDPVTGERLRKSPSHRDQTLWTDILSGKVGTKARAMMDAGFRGATTIDPGLTTYISNDPVVITDNDVKRGNEELFDPAKGCDMVLVKIELRCPVDLNKTQKDYSLNRIRLLGYSIPQEFYQPAYDIPTEKNDPMPDRRSTLYWNPVVEIDKQKGTRVLKFYTSDQPKHYRIVVEGLTETGDPVRYEGELW